MKIHLFVNTGKSPAACNGVCYIKHMPPEITESLDILLDAIRAEKQPARADGFRRLYRGMLDYCHGLGFSEAEIKRYDSQPELAQR